MSIEITELELVDISLISPWRLEISLKNDLKLSVNEISEVIYDEIIIDYLFHLRFISE